MIGMKPDFTFKSGYKVKLDLTDNPSTPKYSFYTPDGDLITQLIGAVPSSLSNRSQIYKEIKTCINPNNVKDKKLEQKIRRVKTILQKQYSALQGEAEVRQMQQSQDDELEERKKVNEARLFIQNLENPLLYIGSLIDWQTAGERINTLLCFCAGCSQIILNTPISVIGYGDASSGKTYIETTALNLLPEKYVVNEKKITEAALFNRSRVDKYFYDGKIVVYGDMGGQNDRDNQQDTLDLMKELQSDGKLVKPISVQDDSNKWITEDLVLEGNPALWYTTVPVTIDDQELSRAIVFTPRTDNRDIFNKRMKSLSFSRGKTHDKFNNVQEEALLIPYMVEHLRQVMEDYEIINPYSHIIASLLKSSKFYKRDADKYTNLLNVITAINFYQNEKYTFNDGQKALITSKDDVALFVSLLSPYLTSISINIKPKSAEVLEILKKNIDDWKMLKESDDENSNYFDVGVTVREFFEYSDTGLKYDNLRKNYFPELYEAGLITIVGKEGNSNMYDVVDYNPHETIMELDDDTIYEIVEYELGEEIAEIIRKDKRTEGLDINNKHEEVEATPW